MKSLLYNSVSAFWVPGNRSMEYLVAEGVPRNKVFQGKYTYDLKDIKRKVDSIDKVTTRRQLNINEKDIVLLFVGTLIPARNISLLLCAFSHIKNNNVRLIIIGDGPEENKVKQSTDDRLIYIPRVSLAELHRYYAISDIYVHPGSEPYSLAVVQAVASDVIVVSSESVGAIDDVLTEGANGYIFDKGSLSGLIEGINKAIEKKDDLFPSIHEHGEKIRNGRSIEYSSDELLQAIRYVKKTSTRVKIQICIAIIIQ